MEETMKTIMSYPRAAAAQLSSSKSLAKSSYNLDPKGEEVESAEAEMSQVREENTRLKMLLKKIESEYKSLKMRVNEPDNKLLSGVGNHQVSSDEDVDQESEELISLCLGRNRKESKKEEINPELLSKKEELIKNGNVGLRLGLANYDESSPDNSLLSTETKEEDNINNAGAGARAGAGAGAGARGEIGQNNKALKTMRSTTTTTTGEDDVVSQSNNNVKRARVSVRARCNTPTMNDGCQWRKYGQKIAKSNPCPRAYYRCTVAASCPVRKQVQRCADDMSILITTYEGTHNHPLPISATAMASTTSAAASMLLSGSSTSPQAGLIGTAPSPDLTSCSIFNGFNINNSTRPFYVPNSSSPSFPTITLDLTASPTTSYSPRFPMTGLGYSQSYSNVQSTIWDSGINPAPFSNRTQNTGSFQTGQYLFQPQLQKNHQMSSQQVLTETLTKAITSDPTFRSVIAAAISTMAGGQAEEANDHKLETKGRNLRWDHDQERSPVRIPSPASHQHQAI